jgi:hypothetical protein
MISMIKSLLYWRREITKFILNRLKGYLEKNDNFLIYITNFWIVFIFIIVLIHFIFEGLNEKWIIFYIWLIVSFFVLRYKKYRYNEIDLMKINNKFYIQMSITFFWLNLSCAFLLYDQMLLNILYDLYCSIKVRLVK